MKYLFIVALIIITMLLSCNGHNPATNSPREQQARDYYAYCQKSIANAFDAETKDKMFAYALRCTYDKYEGTSFGDSCLVAYLPYCNSAELKELLNKIPANSLEYAKDLLIKKKAEEIAHRNTRYFDMQGIIVRNGIAKQVILQEIIEKNTKSTILFFCNIKDREAINIISRMDSCKFFKYNVIVIPMYNTIEDIRKFSIKAIHNLTIFYETENQTVAKYGYGIYILPSVVVINSNGTIIERYKNIYNINQKLLLYEEDKYSNSLL